MRLEVNVIPIERSCYTIYKYLLAGNFPYVHQRSSTQFNDTTSLSSGLTSLHHYILPLVLALLKYLDDLWSNKHLS